MATINTPIDMKIPNEIAAELINAALKIVPSDLITAMSEKLAEQGYIVGVNVEMVTDKDNITELVIEGKPILQWKPMMITQHNDGSIGFHWSIKAVSQ